MTKVMYDIDRELLRNKYNLTRNETKELTKNLSSDDHMLQSMPDASPTKWHLAHTSWFFETFLLKPRDRLVRASKTYEYLFNSYYNSIGAQYPRSKRGLLSRPDLEEIWQYRERVDEEMDRCWKDFSNEELAVVELGINHEQQHQELIVTDIKHALSHNPLNPGISNYIPEQGSAAPYSWCHFNEGIYTIGCEKPFHFDNESPRHDVYSRAFRLASRPVSNGEYLEFIADGGYRSPALWLSEGWAWVQSTGTQAPFYWRFCNDQWRSYTLSGERAICSAEPVCHLTYYEANAFANWAGTRLPTEAEWEIAANSVAVDGHFLNNDFLHPRAFCEHDSPQNLQQMYGDVWEWTQSAYLPYPGFRAAENAVGEYNGKFMINQWVLRGGSCATPAGHIRASYRNFFPVTANWQFSGVRLADECY